MTKFLALGDVVRRLFRKADTTECAIRMVLQP